MKTLTLLLPLVLLLTSCGEAAPKNADAFFDPILTEEELEPMQDPAWEDPNSLKNFAEKYVFTYSELEIKQPSGMCWFAGRLHISDDNAMRVAALNPDGTLETLYLPDVMIPHAITTGDDGNLYVAHGWMNVGKGMQVSIGIFDTNYNEVSPTINAMIPCNPDRDRINSIAAVDDAVYLTLRGSTNEESGKIYKITSDGNVSDIGGNKSFGKLATMPGGFVFVNDDMPWIPQGGNQSKAQQGVSAIYKIAEDTVMGFAPLPTHMWYDFTEEKLTDWADAVTEQTEAPPSKEDIESWRTGIPVFGTTGYGGICISGDKILVASKELPVLHCFDLDLNYLWTQKIGYEGHSMWDLEQRYRNDEMDFIHFYALNMYICEDPNTGELYILQRPFSDTNTFGVLKGTPKV
jgi:hypothetical protein